MICGRYMYNIASLLQKDDCLITLESSLEGPRRRFCHVGSSAIFVDRTLPATSAADQQQLIVSVMGLGQRCSCILDPGAAQRPTWMRV